MSTVSGSNNLATVGSAIPTGVPPLTLDGRPYVHDQQLTGKGCLSVWAPSPRREADEVYQAGKFLGTFHGDRSKPGGWYISIPATKKSVPATAKEAFHAYLLEDPHKHAHPFVGTAVVFANDVAAAQALIHAYCVERGLSYEMRSPDRYPIVLLGLDGPDSKSPCPPPAGA